MGTTSRIKASGIALAIAAVGGWFSIEQAAAQATGTASTAPATLPGGASSLQETFGDWRVSCVIQDGTKRCAMSQEQASAQTRQRVIAIELHPTNGNLAGALLMPFGLALERGVKVQVDSQAASLPLRFRTCLPGGCIVPLNFDATMSSALRGGASLNVMAVADAGQDQPFSVSLKGFSAALDRLSELSP